MQGPHMLQFKHEGLPPFLSMYSIQVSHPAHLPLMLLSTTVVVCEVTVKGSITSILPMNFSLACATLMLLPRMFRLAITGSMVHAVTDTLLFDHLAMVTILLTVSSTAGSRPRHDLNLPISSLVNMSTLGTPRCLKRSDRYSLATMGVYMLSSDSLNFDTTLIALSLLSFSCDSFSFPVCLILPFVYSLVYVHWFIITTAWEQVFMSCPTRALVPVTITHGEVSTNLNMITNKFSNKSVMESMVEFENIISIASTIMRQNRDVFTDAAVITEMHTMASLSARCKHIPNANRSGITYERTNKDWSEITTQLDAMNTNMTTNTCSSLNVRTNEVTSSIICAVACMVRFADLVSTEKTYTNKLVITSVKSVTYAAVLVFAFRHFVAFNAWDEHTSMILFMDPDSVRAMNVYVSPKQNVVMIPSTDPVMSLHKVVNEDPISTVSVFTESMMVAKVYTHAFMDRIADLTVITDVNTLEDEKMIINLVEYINGVVEGVPCSDPETNRIMISTGYLDADMTTHKWRNVIKNGNIFSRMRWFTNMVRHVNLKGICFDCRIALMFSTSIVNSIRSVYETRDVPEVVDKLEDFQTTVGVDGMVN